MLRSRIALIVLVVVSALLIPFASAHASSTVLCSGYSSCSSKGYSNYGYSTHKSTSYWRMYTGTNCTNYVAYRLVTTNGMPNVRPHSGDGNAEDWGTTEAAITNHTPALGSVAWWGRTGHHVAYVEKIVSSTEIVVSESNWSGEFDWRRITSSSGWPDGFIHFADLKLTNITKPSIVGVVKVGSTVSASPGTWSRTATYTYRWYADSVAIPGATAQTLTLTPAQVNARLAVRVTASRPNYPSARVNSAASTVAPGTFVRTIKPAISGIPQVDDTLTATTGTWAPTGSYAYQWYADGTAVAGADTSTFTPGPDQVGAVMTARVTVSSPGYTNSHSTSPPTIAVAPGTLTATTKPSISGRPTIGTKLTAHPGTWSTTGLSYAYQWYADGTAIADATGSTYVPVPANHMQRLSVRVTASKRGYTTNHANSAEGLPVIRGTLTNTAKPVISGHVRVGSRLTATAGSWSAAGEYSYQWYAGHDHIVGATGPSFVLTASQLGHTIYVHVVAHRDGYNSGSANSVRTVIVAPGRISLSVLPTISGTLRVGSKVTVHAGTFRPSGAKVHYQWLRDGKAIPYTTASRTLNSHDHGTMLSVRLTYSAAGYTTRTVTTAQVGPIRAALS